MECQWTVGGQTLGNGIWRWLVGCLRVSSRIGWGWIVCVCHPTRGWGWVVCLSPHKGQIGKFGGEYWQEGSLPIANTFFKTLAPSTSVGPPMRSLIWSRWVPYGSKHFVWTVSAGKVLTMDNLIIRWLVPPSASSLWFLCMIENESIDYLFVQRDFAQLKEQRSWRYLALPLYFKKSSM